MSTKDLARTAVERGRITSYKVARDKAKRARRASERLVGEDHDVPEETPVGKRGYQSENLGPLYRFLDSHVGQNWDKVYSKIRERFDVRTIQSYHIVIDHIIGSVAPVGWTPDPNNRFRFRGYDYYRDKQNRLQKTVYKKPNRKAQQKTNTKKILDFLNNRVVGQAGLGSFFWFVPTTKARLEWRYGRPIFFDGQFDVTPHLRQGRRLTKEELDFMRWNMSEEQRAAICNCSPVPYSGFDWLYMLDRRLVG